MVIILPLGATVNQYLQWAAESSKSLVLSCPACPGVRLHRHDKYQRCAVTRKVLYRVPVYRWICPECGQTVSALPDFLVPYGRFVNSLREQAVRLVVKGETLAKIALKVSSPAVSVVSTRTIRRWVARVEKHADALSSWLAALLLTLVPQLDLFALIPRRPGPRADLHFLLDLGSWWRRLVGRPADAHPGLFAALSRCRGTPGLL